MDSYTKILLHCNGTDASTSITDECNHSVMASGNAQIDTSQSKFGGASLLLDGTGDYLSITNSSDFIFSTKSFTIDLWYRINAYPINGYHSNLFCHSDGSNLFFISFYNNNGIYGYYFYINGIVSFFRQADQSLNTWYHVAFVRSGTLFLIYHNGSLLGEIVTSTIEMPVFNTAPTIGYRNAGILEYFNGWIDEFRLSIGISRYEGNFVTESKEYSRNMNGLYAIPYNTSLIRSNPSELIGLADRNRIGIVGTTKYNYIGA